MRYAGYERYQDKQSQNPDPDKPEFHWLHQSTTLPKLLLEQREKLKAELPPGCCRLVEYLFTHQGARTDFTARAICVCNVSDLVSKNRMRLHNMGLSLCCAKISNVNRYGYSTTIGTWWLLITDPEKWGTDPPPIPAAVNDEG